MSRCELGPDRDRRLDYENSFVHLGGAALRVSRYAPKAAIATCVAMSMYDRPCGKADMASPPSKGPAVAPTPCMISRPPEAATNSPSPTVSFPWAMTTL